MRQHHRKAGAGEPVFLWEQKHRLSKRKVESVANTLELKKFVNCSNHPSSGWPHRQIIEASRYGKIVDVPFPNVDWKMDDREIEELADQVTEKILKQNPNAVMCMGEFVLCFRIVQKLKEHGIRVLATCSERKSVEHIGEDGVVKKESIFQFNGFREY